MFKSQPSDKVVKTGVNIFCLIFLLVSVVVVVAIS